MKARGILILLLVTGALLRFWPEPTELLMPDRAPLADSRQFRSHPALRNSALPGARKAQEETSPELAELSPEEAAALEPDDQWKERETRHQALFQEAQQGHRQPPARPIRGRLPPEERPEPDSVAFGSKDHIPWAVAADELEPQ